MNETITTFLLQYGIPGLVILGLWIELQNQKKEFVEREKVWIEREKLWEAEQKIVRQTLLETIDRNTEILSKLRVLEKIHETPRTS